jgi:DMSO/TMAO reductase YedYZ molybdopterin-dependent catalytic subunit
LPPGSELFDEERRNGRPVNVETPLAGLASERTANDRFFIRSHFPSPALAPARWRLSLSGEVRGPRTWGLHELNRLPQRRVVAVLECAGNSRSRYRTSPTGEVRWGDGAVGSASWQGVALSALFAEAGLRRTARYAVFIGEDRPSTSGHRSGPSFARSLDLSGEEVDPTEILVATRMNGRRLDPDHGGPARLVVPGWYGMAWVKWISEILVRPTPFEGRFQTEKYVYWTRAGRRWAGRPVTWVRVKSLIVRPLAGQRIREGEPRTIFGRAWSGSGPIAKVEVDVGNGWAPARLERGEGPYAWSTWSFRWRPTGRGPVDLRVRATDRAGHRQPTGPAPNRFQYGTNSVHSVRVEVV